MKGDLVAHSYFTLHSDISALAKTAIIELNSRFVTPNLVIKFAITSANHYHSPTELSRPVFNHTGIQ